MKYWLAGFLVIWAGTALGRVEASRPASGGITESADGSRGRSDVSTAEEPVPNEPIEDVIAPLQVELPKPGEVAGEGLQAPVIPEKFRAAYFAERPQSFLIDPQGLLGSADFRERLSFLNYHAGDSSIDLFVYVMGGDQVIPSEIRSEDLIEQFFSDGRPAAVVFYYLGAPQRAKVYLSPFIKDSISAAEQRRALESSIMQAFERTRPGEQFEKFLTQISIRIYWMERLLAGESIGSEVGISGVSQAAAARKPSAKWLMVESFCRKFAFHAVVVVAVLLTAMGIHVWVRFRGRYLFPEFEVEPRLGGAHAAGIGAVISFASAAVPPASQRDQVPDYLRRA